MFNSLKDVLELPIKVDGKQVVTFGDVATVRPSVSRSRVLLV
ncbi:hypothetical protein O9929_08045 [Vibrio lentus]|nr:hypothetical protein [Vibrio lentus]